MSDDKRSGGGGRKPPSGGKKPFGPKKTSAGAGPRRRGVDGDAPPRRSFRDRDEGGEARPKRPARSFAERQDGDRRPARFKPREGEDSEARPARRPFREREGGEERPFKPRRFEERGEARRPFRSRDEGAEGGFRPRRDAERGEGGERSFSRKPRREGDEGGRSFAPRRFDTSFEPREGGRKAFEPRFDDRQEERAPKRAPRRTEARAETVAKPEAEAKSGAFAGERVAKVIARAGLGSRRDAETWIEEGRVAVNGEVLTSAALNVLADDKITVDGKLLPRRERTRLWLYHKPRGLVTTEKDPEGRPTVFENLDPSLPRVMSVGRLDINTEGLLLLTNDGGLARQLELPKTGWLRRYRVRAFGETDQVQLDKLFEGLTVDGVDYGRIEARLDKEQGSNSWLTLGLREGKNREVKNVLGSIGLEVNRLIRVSYGPFQLGDLAEGAVEEVKTRVLMDQLGPELVAEAGCEFEAPIHEATGEKPAKAAAKPAKGGPARGLRVKSEEDGKERVMRGSLVEDRHGRRVLVQRVADVGDEKPARRKPFRPRDEEGGDRPFKPRAAFRDRDEGGERPRKPFRARSEEGGDRPFKPRPSFRDRDEGGERPRKPFRPRDEEGGDRPFKPRPSFRDRDEGGERPRKPFRARSEEGGDRPFKPRPSFRDRDEGGERPRKPFRPRDEEGGDRPFKPRPSFRDRDEGGERPRKPFRPRGEEGGDRPFKPRPSFRDRNDGGERPSRPRPGGKPGGAPRRGR
ncbi:pseudouridine synthase [Labrys neptuniae]|uniref:pseudouridine synthase n=1 Tax=Labrys neptuniae TaxID=376174 RepID=UPI00288E6F3F|nr:pseudouridine synthase [Labrys neptuniae]MDT3382183.1 pseudouridine synthase [Labrys neptuniae]